VAKHCGLLLPDCRTLLEGSEQLESVLVAAKNITVLWDVTPCGLIEMYIQHNPVFTLGYRYTEGGHFTSILNI
jgi:hypothetical protein